MVLDASLLNIQHEKVRIKAKVGQSREISSALPNTLVLQLLKREPSSHPRLRSPTTSPSHTPHPIKDGITESKLYLSICIVQTNVFTSLQRNIYREVFFVYNFVSPTVSLFLSQTSCLLCEHVSVFALNTVYIVCLNIL